MLNSMRKKQNRKKRIVSVIITKEEDWYIARCPQVDIVTQGKTVDETLDNFKEALTLYVESFGYEEIPMVEEQIVVTTPIPVPA